MINMRILDSKEKYSMNVMIPDVHNFSMPKRICAFSQGQEKSKKI